MQQQLGMPDVVERGPVTNKSLIIGTYTCISAEQAGLVDSCGEGNALLAGSNVRLRLRIASFCMDPYICVRSMKSRYIWLPGSGKRQPMVFKAKRKWKIRGTSGLSKCTVDL